MQRLCVLSVALAYVVLAGAAGHVHGAHRGADGFSSFAVSRLTSAPAVSEVLIGRLEVVGLGPNPQHEAWRGFNLQGPSHELKARSTTHASDSISSSTTSHASRLLALLKHNDQQGQGHEQEKEVVQPDFSIMRHYVLHPFVHTDGSMLRNFSSLSGSSPESAGYSRSSSHIKWLRFDQFENGVPPFHLRTGDVVSVQVLPVSPDERIAVPHRNRTMRVYSIGRTGPPTTSRYAYPATAAYSPSASGSTSLNALFVLVNFADAANDCGDQSSSMSDMQYLQALIFNGLNGRSISDMYNTESNGRFNLAQETGTQGSWQAHHFAGPYTLSQYSSSEDCNANYYDWRNAAAAAAAADGYVLTQYGTIVLVTPALPSCAWAGLATLSSQCTPSMSLDYGSAAPACFAIFALCQEFVMAHEMGHNVGLEHSGSDSSNTVGNLGNVYADWSCTMGNDAIWNTANAQKRYVNGWLASSRVLMLSSASQCGTYTLQSLDTPDSQANGLSIIAFNDENNSTLQKTYFFSVRSPIGYATQLGSTYLNGVNIHYHRTDNEYSWFYRTLSDASSFVTPVQGWTFSQMSHDSSAGTAVLSISPPGGCQNSGSSGGSSSSPVSYSWSPGTWSTCTAACGSGTQTRSVSCQAIQNGVTSSVSSAYCSATPQPSASQPCNTQTCAPSYSYSWSYSSWTSCSVSCGSGTQTRTAVCMRSDNTPMNSSFCASSPNSLSQSCNTQTCAPAYSYSWNYSSWSACSASCGSGTQTRTATCMRSDHVPMSSSYCASTQSSLTQNCNTQSCSPSYNYSWSYSIWSACSASCGSGIQTRTSTCMRSDNTSVSSSYCTSAQNSLTQNCNTQSCSPSYNYSWNYGNWSACSASCGSGTQIRTSTCMRSDGTPVNSSYCTSAQSSLNQSCNLHTCTPSYSYSWNYSNWSACSASCGSGFQNRTAICMRSDNIPMNSSSCASAQSYLVQSCSGASCITYSWQTGAWSACSVTCGSRTQTRAVWCQASNQPSGTPAPSSLLCSGIAPVSSQLCSTNVSCVSYVWACSSFSTCSASCGLGVSTRQCSCVNSATSATASSLLCGSTPIQSQSCSGSACSASHWSAGPWSTCQGSCSVSSLGTQTRTVTCINNGVISPAASCSSLGAAPISTQSCPMKCSPQPSYSWITSSWSTCSVSCGSGVQGRSVNCVDENHNIVSPSQCASAGFAPASEQLCTMPTCPTSTNGPFWYTSTFGMCSATCGGGIQFRTVYCFSAFGPLLSNSQCPGTTPTTSQPCNTQQCGSTIVAPACASLPCGEHGICSVNDFQSSNYSCTCQDGYSGSYCDIAPSITDVEVTQQSMGLLVRWQSQGSLPSVSVILRSAVSDVPSIVVGSHMSNSGQMSVLSSVLEGVSGEWFVQIIGSVQAQNSSNPFHLFPCLADTDCNSNGRCLNFSCSCTNGYSGDTCAVAPGVAFPLPSPANSTFTCALDGSTTCSCDSANITLGPFSLPRIVLNSTALSQLFFSELASDLAQALNVNQLRLSNFAFSESASGVFVGFLVLSNCSSAELSSFAPLDLVGVSELLNSLLASQSVTLFSGAVTSLLQSSASAVTSILMATSPPLVSPSTDSNSSRGSGSLTEGGLAGIAVGSVCAALAVIAVVGAVLYRRRRSAALISNGSLSSAPDLDEQYLHTRPAPSPPLPTIMESSSSESADHVTIIESV